MRWLACLQAGGDRYAALEPVSQGVKRIHGSLEADAARGLALRMDHGTQYLSDHFANQVRFWGIEPSYAFLEEPQTNGVAERFVKGPELEKTRAFGQRCHRGRAVA